MNKAHSRHIKPLLSQQKFKEWLERAAYHLCEHCIIDDRGYPICLYVYNMPSYCAIENCPYVEEADP